ncbi:hypothetical protein J2T12_000004 [Paenibacillus anaericanus]|nr:hypothetical protein [Paenibacillus anaericanus]
MRLLYYRNNMLTMRRKKEELNEYIIYLDYGEDLLFGRQVIVVFSKISHSWIGSMDSFSLTKTT